MRDQPGWITFSLDGRHAYPSTGEIIDIASRRVVATLTDETGRAVQSEKVVEIVFTGDRPSRPAISSGSDGAEGRPEALAASGPRRYPRRRAAAQSPAPARRART